MSRLRAPSSRSGKRGIAMKLQVKTFAEYRTLHRDDLLDPSELDEFAVAPGLSTCFGHATTSLDHRVSGAGFRTNSLRYRSSITGETGPRTAETFLLNTQLRRGDRETEASVVSYYEEAVVRMLANDGIESVPSLAMKTVP